VTCLPFHQESTAHAADGSFAQTRPAPGQSGAKNAAAKITATAADLPTKLRRIVEKSSESANEDNCLIAFPHGVRGWKKKRGRDFSRPPEISHSVVLQRQHHRAVNL
jgi:hypothetical protein